MSTFTCFDLHILQKICGCPICKKFFHNLSRHLKLHNIQNEERLALLYALRQCKPKGKARKCPFVQCQAIPGFVRLDYHLTYKHKLQRDDPKYRKFIKNLFSLFVLLTSILLEIKACVVPSLDVIRHVLEDDEKLNYLLEQKKGDALKIRGAIQNLVNKCKKRI